MSALAGRTVMVTGGCGFIGSHLIRRLLAEGVDRVIALDSLRYGSEQNLAGLAGSKRVARVRFTLGSDEPALLDRHLEGVHHLFHLAAEKHNQSKHDSDAVLRANVLGSNHLYEAAVRGGVKKTVFSSSLYSYGRLAGPRSSETDLPIPTTVYGISKLRERAAGGERRVTSAHRRSESDRQRSEKARQARVYSGWHPWADEGVITTGSVRSSPFPSWSGSR